MRRYFEGLYQAMPPAWQAGLQEALRGGAWMGEIPPGTVSRHDVRGVTVFFVHPCLAEQVRHALEGELPVAPAEGSDDGH